MNHESYQQQVSQLVDDELDESLEQDLFVHLGSCIECRDFLKSSWQIQSDIHSRKPEGLAVSKVDRVALRSRWLEDKSPVVFHTVQNPTRLSFRTFALAFLVVILGCLMLSSTVMMNDTALSDSRTVQTNTANGVH